MDDLVRCHAVISNAGNQLIGEAYYLEKPVLALPESGNFEQQVNGYLIDASGGGISRDPDQFDSQDLFEFLKRVSELRENLKHIDACGNRTAIAAIERFLSEVASGPLSRPADNDVGVVSGMGRIRAAG